MTPSAPPVKSVEAFQRDLEPTIIAARNELVTAENFMAYKNNYSIARYMEDGKTLYSFHSRMFFFTELDIFDNSWKMLENFYILFVSKNCLIEIRLLLGNFLQFLFLF